MNSGQGINVNTPILPPLYASVNGAQVVEIVFALFFLFWLVYTLIASYQILRHSHKPSIAVPAIVTHFIVSIGLVVFAVSGLH